MSSDRTQHRPESPPSGRLQLRARIAVCVLSACVLAGCANVSPLQIEPTAATKLSGNQPSSPNGSSPALNAEARPAQAQPATGSPGDREMIVGFKAAAVVLYRSADSNDGEKIDARSLSLPMPARKGAAPAGRLEVSTVNGPRWISRNEVVIAANGAEPPR